MTILILGANGFIGNSLVEKLCKESKYDLYAMDLSSNNIEEYKDHSNFTFVEGDININSEWIEYHIKKCDIIIPLVAIATPNIYVKDPLRVFNLDFESNLKIVKWVAKYNKRIIFPSTSEVYGMCSDENFNEYSSNLVLGPVHKSRWIYSASKQLLDRVIIAYGERGDLSYNLFRPFNWIGPRLDTLEQAQLGNGRVMTIFIYNLLNQKDIILVDGGKQSRSFTDIDDGINALVGIIDKNDINGKIFNIGNPKNSISIKKLATILIERYNILSQNRYSGKIKIKTQNEFYGNGYEDISVRVPDINEAKKHLDWEPKVKLSDSIDKTIEYYLKQRF
tara:strand:+ start:2429 stop:3433 length:1005 start_codon:yes stop_codon:yes gene_type:complete